MRRELRPEVDGGIRRQGDQHARTRRLHEVCDLRGLEIGIDRERRSGRFAAPDDEMGFRQVRQDERHRMFRSDAERLERIGGAGHVGKQFGIGPYEGLGAGVGAEEEGERLRVGRPPRRRGQRLVARSRQAMRGEGLRLEGLDIAENLDRHGSSQRSVRPTIEARINGPIRDRVSTWPL